MRFPHDVPTLSDGVVTLRAHRQDDAEGSWEQCQDPVSQHWTTVPLPYTRDDARRFVTEIMPGGWLSGQEWGFAVEAVGDGARARYAGTVSLRPTGDARAEVAYGSHPWARGRGVMQRAVGMLLDWGFEKQGLETVIWWANQGNWASRRLAWRLGFTFDGSVAHWMPHRGELRDAWVGHLLATDSRGPSTTWFDIPRIEGSAVVLRALGPDDVSRIVEACSDDRTAHWLPEMPQPYGHDNALVFLEARAERHASGAGLTWAVADPATDLLLGCVSVFDVDPCREAEIGYWAHPDARGSGVVTEACRLVTRHGFVPEEDGGLGLVRMYAFAAEGNSASRRVLEANGFTLTGRDRHGTKLRDGTFMDSLAYDILADEFTLPPLGG